MKALKIAYDVHGVGKVKIAQECGVSAQQVYHYFGGRARVPNCKRQSFERAVKTKVNWSAYEDEYRAHRQKLAQKAAHPPEQPKAPELAEPPVSPVSAPENAAAAKSGSFWDRFIIDDGAENAI